ncbi:MAG TPA: alpha/beta fold hydrolase, partial [Gammaproteobacteria bacterium]
MPVPLVLVHGFLGGSAQWQDQVAALSARRPLITPDLPGFGAAADATALSDIGDCADWVLATLERDGVERFDLLGHSMGGMIVQE